MLRFYFAVISIHSAFFKYVFFRNAISPSKRWCFKHSFQAGRINKHVERVPYIYPKSNLCSVIVALHARCITFVDLNRIYVYGWETSGVDFGVANVREFDRLEVRRCGEQVVMVFEVLMEGGKRVAVWHV